MCRFFLLCLFLFVDLENWVSTSLCFLQEPERRYLLLFMERKKWEIRKNVRISCMD
jgi:hypothetical protein